MRRSGIGTRLPATRTLAADLGVSRGVVVRAYEDLAAEGYLHAHQGRGTEVTAVPAAGAAVPAADVRPATNPGLPGPGRRARTPGRCTGGRRDRLVAALTEHLSDWQVLGTAAGLHVLVHPRPDCAEAEVAALARTCGLDARPLTAYSFGVARAPPGSSWATATSTPMLSLAP